VVEQSAMIADLGARLNLALAAEVEELSRFRSDFFGRLRTVLGDRDEVRIVGDRFVFQSEVLFGTGEAEIGAEGARQLAQLADTLIAIADEIPDELPWVLQVDGHTDRRPISTARFPSNWELSAARAISVAQFLVSQGIPPDRVAARGFAQFQPLDPADTLEAYRRNRRIEIKLTTR
jgi:chemotaxis protein MotB